MEKLEPVSFRLNYGKIQKRLFLLLMLYYQDMEVVFNFHYFLAGKNFAILSILIFYTLM